MREHRPDVRLTHVGFDDPEGAGDAVLADFASGSTPDALFVVWDEPALAVARALREAGRPIPMTTVDLGSGIALEIARGELVKGAGAQLPFDQGEAEAMAAIMALAGDEPPAWIALPALAVTRDNVIDAYQAVWHEPAPPSLGEALTTETPVADGDDRQGRVRGLAARPSGTGRRKRPCRTLVGRRGGLAAGFPGRSCRQAARMGEATGRRPRPAGARAGPPVACTAGRHDRSAPAAHRWFVPPGGRAERARGTVGHGGRRPDQPSRACAMSSETYPWARQVTVSAAP